MKHKIGWGGESFMMCTLKWGKRSVREKGLYKLMLGMFDSLLFAMRVDSYLVINLEREGGKAEVYFLVYR